TALKPTCAPRPALPLQPQRCRLQPQPPDVLVNPLAYHRPKDAVEVKGREVRQFGEPVQRQLLVEVLLDEELDCQDPVTVRQVGRRAHDVIVTNAAGGCLTDLAN